MAERYQQFLGSRPGLVVELVDGSSSPYLVRTADGFEFCVSAEDFGTYYRKENESTPERWIHLVTDPDTGTVDSPRVGKAMETIRHFSGIFQDFDKARAFVREVAHAVRQAPQLDAAALRERVTASGWDIASVSEGDLELAVSSPDDILSLFASDTCAVVTPFTLLSGPENGEHDTDRLTPPKPRPAGTAKKAEKASAKPRKVGMKNAEMVVEGNMLTITADLSKEFGPSKSGKTIIVASSEGNKTIPGTECRIGLNVYRQPDKRPAKGRVKSFKNVEMDVQGDVLTITVDLSQESGPSKSGKTVIIASTEGNRLVFGREEKIGMNVYRSAE